MNEYKSKPHGVLQTANQEMQITITILCEYLIWVTNIHLRLTAEAFNKYFLNLVKELNMEYINRDFAISFPRNWFPDGFP
jgi:hypothetical protein